MGIAIGSAVGLALIITAIYYAFLKSCTRRKLNASGFSRRFQRTTDVEKIPVGFAAASNPRGSGSSFGSRRNLTKIKSGSSTGSGRIINISVPIKPFEDIIPPAQVYQQPEEMVMGEFGSAMRSGQPVMNDSQGTMCSVELEAPLPPVPLDPGNMYRGTETTRRPETQYDELDILNSYARPERWSEYDSYDSSAPSYEYTYRSSSPTIGKYLPPPVGEDTEYRSAVPQRGVTTTHPKSQIFF